MSKLFIAKHIELKNNSVFINGKEDFSHNKQDEFLAFAKAIYKNYKIKYGKFYKMDALSKLGFLASDLLLKDVDLDTEKEEVAIIFANSSSSLNTDIKYQKTINDVPSPSAFVYTLPNIVIGEICIRNGFRGETMFFVQKKFDEIFISNYVNNIFESTNTKYCITAWIEINEDGNYHAKMFLVSKNKTDLEFNKNNISLK